MKRQSLDQSPRSTAESSVSNAAWQQSIRKLTGRVMTISLVISLVAGCSEGDKTPPIAPANSDSIHQIGILTGGTAYTKRDGTIETPTVFSATFRQFQSPLIAQELSLFNEYYSVDLMPECKHRESYPYTNFQPPSKPRPPASQLVSAGDSITMSTPEGSWHEISPGGEGAFDGFQFLYQTDYRITEPLPVGAFFDIPGDVFPQFDSVTIPDVERLRNVQITNIEDSRVTVDSRISWDSAVGSDNLVSIDFSIDGVIVQNEWGDLVVDNYINCYVNDTGEFTFPHWIKTLLRDNEMSTDVIRITRIAQSVVRANSTLLYVQNAKTFEGFD